MPKPLITAVEELGEVSQATADVLRKLGANNDATYLGQFISVDRSSSHNAGLLLVVIVETQTIIVLSGRK